MHLLDRIRLHRQRKQTLNYIADLYLYEQQQAAQVIQQPVQQFNPMQTEVPNPEAIAQRTTPPMDPMTESVNNLISELDKEEKAVTVQPTNRQARMFAINKRLGVQ